MVQYEQTLRAYAIKDGVDNSVVKMIGEVKGNSDEAKDHFSDLVWGAFEADPLLAKIVIKRFASLMIPKKN